MKEMGYTWETGRPAGALTLRREGGVKVFQVGRREKNSKERLQPCSREVKQSKEEKNSKERLQPCSREVKQSKEKGKDYKGAEEDPDESRVISPKAQKGPNEERRKERWADYDDEMDAEELAASAVRMGGLPHQATPLQRATTVPEEVQETLELPDPLAMEGESLGSAGGGRAPLPRRICGEISAEGGQTTAVVKD